MNRKLSILKSFRNMISASEKQRFYTMEEKKEMALKGKDVPICVGTEKSITEYIVPMHQYIPSKANHKKAKKMKI